VVNKTKIEFISKSKFLIVFTFFVSCSVSGFRLVNQGAIPTDKKYNICVSSWSASPFTEKIVQGFVKTLSANENVFYEIKKYNAYLNPTLARSQMEEIIQGKPDLIFTTGLTCSKMAKEITEKRDQLIPIVFCGVKDPVDCDIVKSEMGSGNHIAGVSGVAMPWNEQIDWFLEMKPTMQKALILCNYRTSDVIKNDVLEIKKQLHLRGIQAKEVAVYGMSEVIQKVTPFLEDSSYDTLFCLRDGTSISVMDSLVKLCNRHCVTLFSTYLEGAEKGAAFSLGMFERDFGTKSAELAMRILEEGVEPSELPLVKIGPEEYQLHINSKTAKLQGLHLNSDISSLAINKIKII